MDTAPNSIIGGLERNITGDIIGLYRSRSANFVAGGGGNMKHLFLDSQVWLSLYDFSRVSCHW
jgi:hypothetical protein